MSKHLLTIAISLLLPSILVAQTETWSLEKCITYAQEHNIDVALSDLDVNTSQANLEQSKHQFLPDLNGFASNNYNWGRSFDVFTNDAITQRVRSNNFALQSNFTIFNGFQNVNSLKQSKLDYEARKKDAEATRNNVALNVANAYLQVLLSLELLESSERQLASSETQIEQTRKLVDAGRLPEINLLDLLSQRATNALDVVNRRNNYQLALLQLKQLLQLPGETAFEIAAPELADPPEDALVPDSEEIIGTAESILPEMKSAELTIKSSNLGIDLAKAGYYPRLTLNAGINTFFSSAQETQARREEDGTVTRAIGYIVNPDPSNGLPETVPVLSDVPNTTVVFEDFGFWQQLEESRRSSIGVSLSIPIYNRHQVRTQVANAEINYERARLNAERVRNQIRQNVENARLDAYAAAESFNASKLRYESLKETFRVTEQQYKLGATDITAFTLAQNNLFAAEADLARAKFDYIFKMKILDFYLGKPITLE